MPLMNFGGYRGCSGRRTELIEELMSDSHISVDFGEMFLEHVLEPLTGNDPDNIIGRASETLNGELTEYFAYLDDYVNGTVV